MTLELISPPPFTLDPVEEDARHWLAQGFTVVAVGGDAALLARQTEELAAKFKSTVS